MRPYLRALLLAATIVIAACSTESESTTALREREQAAEHFQDGKYPHPQPIGNPISKASTSQDDDKHAPKEQ